MKTNLPPKETIENVCDVCCGNPDPWPGLPEKKCFCGGSGKLTDLLHNLRVYVFDLEAELDAAVEVIKILQCSKS